MSGKIIPSAIINLNIPSTSMEVRKREVDEKLTGISQEIINYIPNSPDDFVTNMIMERKFEFHYNNWLRRTVFKSNVHEIIVDNDFQAIIEMKEKAIPLILRKINDQPNYLVWALNMITGIKQGKSKTTTITEACRLWVKWGASQNLI